MKHTPQWLALATVIALFVACSDDSTGLEDPTCLAATTAVNASVVVGASVVFDWSPGCAVAMLLVEEEGGSDRWWIGTPDDDWETPGAGNQIVPPITYGQIPSGITDSYGPEPLIEGRTYQLVLWRILPSGSTAQCQHHIGSACLLAVETFTR